MRNCYRHVSNSFSVVLPSRESESQYPDGATYPKKEITLRLSNLVDRAIDAAELLIWENEDVVLVEMGGAILHEMMRAVSAGEQ